jgi:hypothetical protein
VPHCENSLLATVAYVINLHCGSRIITAEWVSSPVSWILAFVGKNHLREVYHTLLSAGLTVYLSKSNLLFCSYLSWCTLFRRMVCLLTRVAPKPWWIFLLRIMLGVFLIQMQHCSPSPIMEVFSQSNFPPLPLKSQSHQPNLIQQFWVQISGCHSTKIIFIKDKLPDGKTSHHQQHTPVWKVTAFRHDKNSVSLSTSPLSFKAKFTISSKAFLTRERSNPARDDVSRLGLIVLLVSLCCRCCCCCCCRRPRLVSRLVGCTLLQPWRRRGQASAIPWLLPTLTQGT